MIFVKARNTHDLRQQLRSMFPIAYSIMEDQIKFHEKDPNVNGSDYSNIDGIVTNIVSNGITIDIPIKYNHKKILIKYV